jgi:flagellar biosynthesis protein FlhF
MKIKRFFAADMRTAIRQVREQLGSDAVILSNKSVDGGVELVAALDFDESKLAPAPTRPSSRPQVAASKGVVTAFPRPEESGSVEQPQETESPEQAERAPKVEWSQDPLLVDMRKEMQVLRRMVENELSGMNWEETDKRKPQVSELLRRLIALDLPPAMCQRLVEKVGEFDAIDEGWRKALYNLASELNITGDELLEQGGVVAVVGPTGVGKTTTIAKLAARFALRHGNRHIALISTDSYRIGGQEQLATYARILDVPIRMASNVEELNIALNAFAEKRLVLVDTAGMSMRDVRIGEHLSLLHSGNRPVRTFLALSAATQHNAMQQTIKSFGVASPEAVILTKMDETASLGGVFSALVDSDLPVAYITDGQKVPEDIQLARTHSLVSRAVSLAQQEGTEYSEEYLAMTLGGARLTAHG